MDWSSLFEFNVSAIELIARGTLMYWLLFLIFRFVTRRDVGAVGVADVLLLVIVADAAQNAMSGGYDSVAEGAVLVATLIFWNVLLDWAAFRFTWVRRFAEPKALLLVHRGRVLHRNLRREFVTMRELQEHLRQHGVVNIADVRAAFMESDGSFSVITYKDVRGRQEAPEKAAQP
ncbi:MAG TPA: YetF domain-containing protein [Albitalea sp.]|nr:YetF domain-containing protein [Albitalea sp.]